MIPTNSRAEVMFGRYQHETLLPLRLNYRPQGGLETSRKECKVKTPESKKPSLKSVALTVKSVDDQWHAWRPVSNMVIIKK